MVALQTHKGELLAEWHERAVRANLAHYIQSERYAFRNTAFTVVNIIAGISVLVFTNAGIFGPEHTAISEFVARLITILSGVFVVITSTLQHIFKYEEKRLLHKVAGNAFTEIKRSIERGICTSADLEKLIERVETDHNNISKIYPLVTPSAFRAGNKRANSEGRLLNSLFSHTDLGGES